VPGRDTPLETFSWSFSAYKQLYRQGCKEYHEGLAVGRRVRGFSVIIMEDDGGYIAVAPELPGCHTQGGTVDEALENAREAIELYLETLSEEEKEELLSRRVVGLQRIKAVA